MLKVGFCSLNSSTIRSTAVEACLALDKIDDCLELCELGLTKFPGCQKLTEAHAKARQKQSLSDQAEIAKLKAQHEEENKQLTTFKLITAMVDRYDRSVTVIDGVMVNEGPFVQAHER
ncbi:hypothetical protein CLF_109158 [Clonorchis sinensis]|uniref:Uncharacterized protein n=1 Tax=Clonorchis sinensis TaxID=79923 RepID=G7YJ08_CLOSI|nr:hypothetical protein CLF_109158 [Clonorchis sinensis]